MFTPLEPFIYRDREAGCPRVVVVVTLKTAATFLKSPERLMRAAISGPNGLLRCLGSRSGLGKRGGQGDRPGNQCRPIRFPPMPECPPPAAAHCRGSGRLSGHLLVLAGHTSSKVGYVWCQHTLVRHHTLPEWLGRRLTPCHADATQPCTHILCVSLMCACVVQDFHADAFRARIQPQPSTPSFRWV